MHFDEARGILANLIAQGATYIIAALGYTPANRAGDTFTGNVGIGNAPASRLHLHQAATPMFLMTDNVLGATYGGAFCGRGVAGKGGYAEVGVYNAGAYSVTMTFDESNNVGIGLVPSGTYKLEINGKLSINSATLIRTATSFTNGAAAAAGTLLNAPAAGNPTKWIPIDDNGTTRYIPAW